MAYVDTEFSIQIDSCHNILKIGTPFTQQCEDLKICRKFATTGLCQFNLGN